MAPIIWYNYSKDCYAKIQDELCIAFIPSCYDTTADTVNQFEGIWINVTIIAGMGEVIKRINTIIIKISCIFLILIISAWLIIWGEGYFSHY